MAKTRFKKEEDKATPQNSTPRSYGSDGSSGPAERGKGLFPDGATADPPSMDRYKPEGSRRRDEDQGSTFSVSRTGAYSGTSPDDSVRSTHFSDDPVEKKRR